MHTDIRSLLTFPIVNLLLQEGWRLASIREEQWGRDVPEWNECWDEPGLLYEHIHRSEYCVGGHSTMSIHSWECSLKIVTAICDVASFRWELSLMMRINAAVNCRCWWNTSVGSCAAKFAFELHILTEPNTHDTSSVARYLYSNRRLQKHRRGLDVQQKGEEEILRHWAATAVKDTQTDLECEMNLHHSVWLTGYLDRRELFTWLHQKKKERKDGEKKNHLRGFVAQTSLLALIGDRGTDLCLHDATLWFTGLRPPHSPLAGKWQRAEVNKKTHIN